MSTITGNYIFVLLYKNINYLIKYFISFNITNLLILIARSK